MHKFSALAPRLALALPTFASDNGSRVSSRSASIADTPPGRRMNLFIDSNQNKLAGDKHRAIKFSRFGRYRTRLQRKCSSRRCVA
jgi:hypothetical protein